MRVLVAFDGRSVVMAALRLCRIGVRMSVTPANTQRELQRQHHCGQQGEQVGDGAIHDFD